MNPGTLTRGQTYLYNSVEIIFQNEGLNYYYFRVTANEPIVEFTFTQVKNQITEIINNITEI